MTTTATKCSSCGEDLGQEEAESPRLDDDDGEPICDDCYHEHYEFTCCCCEEYGHVDDQHKLLVVFEETSDVKPGVYKVIRTPYVTHAMIGEGWLHPGALERIADVNPDMSSDYPCGHLCAGCQAKVLAQFAGKCSGCKQQSAFCLRVRLCSWKDVKAGKYQWSRPKVLCAGCRHSHRGAWEMVKKS